MKKLLSVIMVGLMATSAFAYVPLSNSQLNIGSYQNSATRGMFYNELDILSAAPVELLDFSGNALYTNWGNARSFAGPYNPGVDYNQALSWTGVTEPVNYFTFGVTGNPLSYAGIEDSRSGIVYQNFGGKTVQFNLDDDVGTGQNPGVTGEDSEGTWENKTYTVLFPTMPLTNDRLETANSDAKYHTNTTNTQWNIGSSYKLMDKVSVGLSLARQTDTNILTTEGTKTYAYRELTGNGAVADGLTANLVGTDLLSYTFAYPTQEIDQNSTSRTDILPQARIKISDDFYVDAGVGLSFQKTLNPVGTAQQIVAGEKTVVTVTATEFTGVGAGVVFSTAPGATQIANYTNTGTAIVDKNNAGLSLDYDATGNIPAAGLASTVFTRGALEDGVSAFADDRDGTAPLIRIEAVKKFEKVDITGIVNYSNLSQDVDASQTDREYIQTSCVISTWSVGGQDIADGNIKDNFVQRDYTSVQTITGKGTISNFDVGAKVSMKALEGVKVSFGGFIQKQTNKEDGDWTYKSTELTSYNDGIVSTNVYNNGSIVSPSSGTYIDADGTISGRPGPVGGTDQTASRGAIETSGDGEGTWSETVSQTGTFLKETITTIYRVPVGIEIPLSKKWTFRAGTEYVMTKTETTTEQPTNQGTKTKVATPGSTAQGLASVTNVDTWGPSSKKSVYKSENQDVYYTYGVQFDATPSLTIACNAFLDTAADNAAAHASIFDLTTYRQLSLSAAIRF